MTADEAAPTPDVRAIDKFADRTAEVLRRLDAWSADQRGREEWQDFDRATYRYNAETLEVAAEALREARAERDRYRKYLSGLVNWCSGTRSRLPSAMWLYAQNARAALRQEGQQR